MYDVTVYHFSRQELEEKDQDFFEDLTKNEGWVEDIEDIEMALGSREDCIEGQEFRLPVSALDILEMKWEGRFDSGICMCSAIYYFSPECIESVCRDLSDHGTREAALLAEYLRDIPDTEIVVIEI